MRHAAVLALVVCVAVLAGCGPAANRSDDGPKTGIRLSVPPSATTSSIDLVLEHVGVDAGTQISLYAYRTDWDAKPPLCQGEAEQVGTATVKSDGRETVNASVTQGPGRYWWVVVAPGYTSECAAEGSQTRLLASPEIELAQQDPRRGLDDPTVRPTPLAGHAFPYNVSVSEPPPKDSSWTVTVNWYGPFESTPEAVSEGCDDDTPVAATTTVKAADTRNHAARTTPPEAGVYRVVAEIAETQHSVRATSGCDDQSSLVAVE